MNSLRGGMQVHAVPESERAYDASGRQLPWGYEYADPERNARRIPEEKGPFGRSTRRRGMSRSKTVTPARKEDQTKVDNLKVIDDIFNNLKAENKAKEASLRERTSSMLPGSVTTAAPGAESVSISTTLPSAQPPVTGEPTEVILYGFEPAFQYAALEFYERVSLGSIYEDYDRHPAHSKYNLSLSLSRASSQRSLSQTALRKKNHYMGGEHWIKVTFDSPEAADRACYYSPHIIHGYLVYAERFRGVGPDVDAAIPATHEAIQSATTSPSRFSSNTLPARTATSPSSETASSTTAAGAQPDSGTLATTRRSSLPSAPGALLPDTAHQATASTSAIFQFHQSQQAQQQLAPLRVRGAKRAVLLPAEEALMPKTSRWRWPLLGLILGTEISERQKKEEASLVPRKEDGSFDWDKAGWYWRVWAWLDLWLGTDFVGLKGE